MLRWLARLSRKVLQTFDSLGSSLFPQGIRLTVKEFDSLFTFYDKVREFVAVCLLFASTKLFFKMAKHNCSHSTY